MAYVSTATAGRSVTVHGAGNPMAPQLAGRNSFDLRPHVALVMPVPDRSPSGPSSSPSASFRSTGQSSGASDSRRADYTGPLDTLPTPARPFLGPAPFS